MRTPTIYRAERPNARRFAFAHREERLHQVPAVIGVGRRACGHHAGQVPGHHDVGVGAADAPLRAVSERIDAAGAHDADAAGEPQLAEAALGLLGGKTLPDGFQPLCLGFGFQGQDVGVDGDVSFCIIGLTHFLALFQIAS